MNDDPFYYDFQGALRTFCLPDGLGRIALLSELKLTEICHILKISQALGGWLQCEASVMQIVVTLTGYAENYCLTDDIPTAMSPAIAHQTDLVL
jgi:hypothetical protein